MHFLVHERISVRQMPPCKGGWKQKFHYAFFILWVIARTLSRRPTWIYASDLWSCPPAFLLSYIPKIQVIYHEHDSFSSLPTSIFFRFCLWARRRLARRAGLCVLPNEQRAAQFAKEAGSNHKVLCVWNCPRQEEISAPRSPKTEESLGVYYHGNLSPDLFPPTILDAVAKAGKDIRLFIVGYGTRGKEDYIAKLRARSDQLGIEERVRFFEPVPRHELWQIMQNCDAGLALMPRGTSNSNFRMMVGASNKPFDYLAGGLALLVSDLPDWKKTYADPGYGLVCNPDDPQSIAKAFLWLFEHPGEMRAMGERGRQRILSEWNYEQQFSPVLERLTNFQR